MINFAILYFIWLTRTCHGFTDNSCMHSHSVTPQPPFLFLRLFLYRFFHAFSKKYSNPEQFLPLPSSWVLIKLNLGLTARRKDRWADSISTKPSWYTHVWQDRLIGSMPMDTHRQEVRPSLLSVVLQVRL